MRSARTIAKRELRAYFNSPMAYVVLGIFSLLTILWFFNAANFFSQGQASMRGFFESVPWVLAFLVPALTMRLWAEEAKQGTMETLLTMPARDIQLILGKFFASWALLGFGLVLTFGLPITVATLGDLDWGPVIGGYLGAMLLGAAYLGIGLFVSSTTQNQLLAFLLSCILCLFFFGLGRIGQNWADAPSWLQELGTGHHFESIARGVIDLRDLIYYLSLTGFFLVLNLAALRARRW